jgi:hypothetical protein
MQTLTDPSVRAGRFTHRFSFYDEPAIVQRLEALAARETVSSAALVRTAIRRLLEAADKEVSR